MRKGWLLAAGGALALAAIPASSAAATGASGSGLWSPTYQPSPTDCGVFVRDTNNFCVADDSGAVELGVKFTSSKAVQISGVRMYRVDADSQTASLWSSSGTLLATGASAASATPGWQDVAFSQPVSVGPGQTYIASYYVAERRLRLRVRVLHEQLADGRADHRPPVAGG